MIRNFLQRYLKKPQTVEQLIGSISASLYDIEWLKEYNITLYNHLKNYEYSNGANAEAVWRSDFIESINLIANETTWETQKQALIKTMLGAVSLAGMSESIVDGYLEKIECYEDIVCELAPFKANEKRFWKTLVAELHQKNKLDLALLKTIGERIYAIDDITILSIDLYGSLIKDSFKRRLLFKDMLIRYGAAATVMKTVLLNYYDEFLQPVVEAEQRSLASKYNDIVDERIADNWAEDIIAASDTYNKRIDELNDKIDKLIANC